MEIKFWGVRGSIPSPSCIQDCKWKLEQVLMAAKNHTLNEPGKIQEFIESLPRHLSHPIGGNTPCLQISHGNDMIIVDAGSGLRLLGQTLHKSFPFDLDNCSVADLIENADLNSEPGAMSENQPLNLSILLSHTHWDHIQGFPFFTPAFVKGNTINIYGLSASQLKNSFWLQQTSPSLFPIDLENMGAEINFHSFPKEGLRFGQIFVESFFLPHPGGSLAYKITAGEKRVIYATDFEFTNSSPQYISQFIEFIMGADVLISDTQYTYLEGVAREGWGHSTSFGAIELARRGKIKHFFLFHHDPTHEDRKLIDNLEKTKAYHAIMSAQKKKSMIIELAVEGATLTI